MKKFVLVIFTIIILTALTLSYVFSQYRTPLLGLTAIFIVLIVAYYLWYKVNEINDEDQFIEDDTICIEISDYINEDNLDAFASLVLRIHGLMTKYYEDEDPLFERPQLEKLTLYDAGYLEAIAWRLHLVDYVHCMGFNVQDRLKLLPQFDLIIAKELLGSEVHAIRDEMERRIVAKSVEYYDSIQNNPLAEQAIESLAKLFIGVTDSRNYRYIARTGFIYARNRYRDSQKGAICTNKTVLDNIVTDVVGQLTAENVAPGEVQSKALPMIQSKYEETLNTKPMHAKHFRALQREIITETEHHYQPLISWVICYIEAKGSLPINPIRILEEDGNVEIANLYDTELLTDKGKEYLVQGRVRLGIRQKRMTQLTEDKLLSELKVSHPMIVEMYLKGMLSEYLLASYSSYKPIMVTESIAKLLVHELKYTTDVRSITPQRNEETGTVPVVQG